MRVFLLALTTLGMAFGADSASVETNSSLQAAIQKKATALVYGADQAAASDHNGDAETGYKAAILQCDRLPPDKYHCKTDVLWSLGKFYSHIHDREKAEAVYKERFTILMAHQKAGARPDLDIGVALFDLQSVTSNPNDASRDGDEAASMERARRFYEHCKSGFPDLWQICDRRLADVEGLHGSLLTLKKRFDEAAPFLKSVIDRPDSGVRAEIMVSSLNAYATALILQGKATEAEEYKRRAQGVASLTATQQPASGAYKVGGGVSAPQVASKREPTYTNEARLARLVGRVVLTLIVREDGVPSNLAVIKSLGFGLDEEALDAVRTWRFAPGQKEGRSVPVFAMIDVNFQLGGGAGRWHLTGAAFKAPDGASPPKLEKVRFPTDTLSGQPASFTLTFDVDAGGRPTNIRVEKSSDPKWEQKVINAVSAWKFSPGLKDGTPLSVPLTIDLFQVGPSPAAPKP